MTFCSRRSSDRARILTAGLRIFLGFRRCPQCEASLWDRARVLTAGLLSAFSQIMPIVIMLSRIFLRPKGHIPFMVCARNEVDGYQETMKEQDYEYSTAIQMLGKF
jgi:hypothetical protein